MSITGKLHTYPSPNPTLTLTCYQLATPRATLTHLSCSPNFSRASYLDERTDDVWTNCFITFSTRWKNFFRGICLRMSWACTIGIWSTSRNWIWLDKFTSYVIIIVLIMECGARWLSSIPGCQVLRFMGRMTRSKYLYHSVAMFLLL